MNKEKWVNEVMNSLEDIKSAEVSPFLYNSILNRISSGEIKYTPMKLVWLAAASFAILLLLNIKIISSSRKASKSANTEVQTLANGYQLSNENTLNYNQ